MLAQNHLLQKATAFLRSGDQQTARQILLGILKENNVNQAAWIYYAKTFASPMEQVTALRKALECRPEMKEVRRALLTLEEKITTLQSTTVALPTVRTTNDPRPGARDTWHGDRLKALPRLAPAFFALLVLLAGIAIVVVYLTYGGMLAMQTGKIEQLQHENQTLLSNQLQTLKDLQQTQINLRAEQERYSALDGEYQTLRGQNQALTQNYQNLQNEHRSLVESYTGLEQQNRALQTTYNNLSSEHSDLQQKAIVPPYIKISKREMDMTFYLRNGNIDHWTIPFDVLQWQLQRGEKTREEFKDGLHWIDLVGSDGSIYSEPNYRILVDPAPFENVMATMYNNSPNDEAFLDQVWYTVTQLSQYTSDGDQETPRYPLETLLAGGGDCEDSSILFASLVRAAPVSWRVWLVFINSDTPYTETVSNHVIVRVDTGMRTYLIETTGGSTMAPYQLDVKGRFLELP